VGKASCGAQGSHKSTLTPRPGRVAPTGVMVKAGQMLDAIEHGPFINRGRFPPRKAHGLCFALGAQGCLANLSGPARIVVCHRWPARLPAGQGGYP
jgi:hypothetical protein